MVNGKARKKAIMSLSSRVCFYWDVEHTRIIHICKTCLVSVDPRERAAVCAARLKLRLDDARYVVRVALYCRR